MWAFISLDLQIVLSRSSREVTLEKAPLQLPKAKDAAEVWHM
ncbi:hypothetical protein [Natronosporangium hydrolyticum]|nr:hypothetical protein [Natronosporangium hydrolyticum]